MADSSRDPCRALVTGATGFIGGHLVGHLSSLGWDVHAIARSIPSDPSIQRRAVWHCYDGTYTSVADAVGRANPSVVFHLASRFISVHQPDQIDQLLSANLRFGTFLLEAMHESDVSRLINTGSSWQHFNGSDYDPVNLYAATKQAFEAIVDYYCNAHQFSVVTLKLHDTYGPDDSREKLIPILKRSIATGDRLEMSDGLQRINLTHVSDVCVAFAHAAKFLDRGQHRRYSVEHPTELSIRAVVEKLTSRYSATLQVDWGSRARPSRSMGRPPRLPLLPGWKPTRDFPAS